MTPEQKEYFDREIKRLRSGGNELLEAYVIDRIVVKGSYNLGPVNPPVVGLSGNCIDYSTYFNDWNAVNAFIKELTDKAQEAWGPQCAETIQIDTVGQVAVNPENYKYGGGIYTFPNSGNQTIPMQLHPLSDLIVDPVTGDVSLKDVKGE